MRRAQNRSAAPGWIEPCQPTEAARPPSGEDWIHEAKFDGYRMMVRKDGAGVRVLTRKGFDWTSRYPKIFQTAKAIKGKSFLIDGDAVCCNNDGMPIFDMLRKRRNDPSVILVAFDLIELNGSDLRREPIEARKAALVKLLRGASLGIQLNDYIEADAATVFRHACEMGLEGIVSKRRGSIYQSGRTLHWLKLKNPNSPAVKRVSEEEW